MNTTTTATTAASTATSATASAPAPATPADLAAQLSRRLGEQLAAAAARRAGAGAAAEDTATPAGAGTAAEDTATPAGAGTAAEDTATPAPDIHGPRVSLPPGSGMAGDAATEAQRAHADDLARRLSERTRTSKELTQRHRAVLADSRAVVGFRRSTKETLYPLAAREARGARLTDVDSNTYTDITMGFGALLFGHEPEFVTEAVREHLGHGLRFGPRPVEAGEVAELLARTTGLERVAFAASGTEANSAAIRLARAATGRSRIVMFRGSYHGHIDAVLGRPGPDGRGAVPVSRGIPDSAVADLVVLEYGSDEALDTIDVFGGSLAAVLVEPVQCRNPGLRPVAFLRRLRELTRRHGIVLLFDEMLTGLRPHPRGAQHHFGVVPDLATYGKALGSGFPIGAIAGRADLLDGVDGGFWRYGDDSRPMAETTFFGGTYLQHPLSMAAAKAVLTHLHAEGPALQERLNTRTDALAAELNRFFAEEEFPLELAHFGSMFRFTHRADMDLLYRHLLLRGVYVWEWRSFYLSTAHTDADVEHVADAVKDSLRELRRAGFFPARRPARPRTARPRRPLDFGVYFFGDCPDAPAEAYERLLDTARFADEHGFSSVWLPERHFHSFGGLSPNPAVPAAALARETSRIRINAGSVVLPLHDPVRIAEEWAVVDNLSGGRVGIGCALGWHARDFALHPDRFADRREIAFAHLDDVRTLWRGGSLRRTTGEGRPVDVTIHPRPVQDLPPMFLATSGRRASYEEAGRRGLGVVTNLMNQSVAELAENIRHYRKTREQQGLDPDTGRVTVLLHTYLGADRDTARAEALEPMSRYLRSSLEMRSAARASGAGPGDLAAASEDDLDHLFRRAYDRYCDERALIGTPDSCAPLVEALHAAGVDEIAALVDFGMPAGLTRAGLTHLDTLRRRHGGDHGSLPSPDAGSLPSTDAGSPASTDAGSLPSTDAGSPASISAGSVPSTGAGEVSAPVTDAQRRLWLAARLLGDPSAYNEVQAVRLRGPLDERALRTAVDGLVARHAGLRTVFREGGPDGTVRQVLRPGPHPALTVTDARGRDAGAAIATVLHEESTRPYDLAEGPLFTPRLLRLAGDDHVLVLGLHHLVTDGHSAGIVAADLAELYRAAVEGRPAVFARPAGSTLQAPPTAPDPADLAWWRRYLDPLPPAPVLPTDRPRARRVAGRGGAEESALDERRAAGLRAWSGRQGVTLFATLLTAWQLVLRERSGQDEFVVGSTFGRRRPGTEDTVGFHVAVLPLKVSLTDTTPLRDAVRATRDALLAAEEHQHVDLDALLAAVHPDPGHPRPLVAVSADLDNAPLTRLDLPGLRAEEVPGGTASAPLELALTAVRTPSGLRLRIRYDADLYDASTVRGLLADLDRVLAAMTRDGAERVADTRPGPSLPAPGQAPAPAPAPVPAPAPAPARTGDVLQAPSALSPEGAPLASPEAPPATSPASSSRGTAGPAAGDVLEALRDVWASLLGVRAHDVPDDADFFQLGGHSIAAIRLRNRLREEFGADVPLADFFAEPTLPALHRRLTGGAGTAGGPAEEASADRAPVSDQQARMLAAHHSLPRPQVLNVPTRIRLTGPLDPGALRSALTTLVERHHALRTRFVRDAEGTWWQEAVDAAPRLRIDDYSALPADRAAARAERACRAEADEPFDLTRPTLPRLRLLRTGADTWVLMVVVHHICTDGWSHGVLLGELAALYTAAAAGTDHQLPAPSAQPADHARRVRAHADPAERARRAAHFTRYLDGVPYRLDLPTDRPRPDRLSGAGETLRASAPAGLREKVEAFAAASRVTPFAVAAAGLGLLLARLSGQRPDVLLSIPYAHREDTGTESLVSILATAVPMRVRAGETETCAELVARTGAETLAAMAHVLPTADVLAALRDAGAREVPELVPYALAFQNTDDEDVEIPGLRVEVDDLAPPAARTELTFGLTPCRDPALGYRAFLEYSTDLWDRATAQRFLDSYLEVLDALCERPDRPVHDLLTDPHLLSREALPA